jgi:nicotinate dehydrogenase subunit B
MMSDNIHITVNGEQCSLNVHPETPLLFVLRNDLKLKSPKLGCAKEQCGACKVLVDGNAIPSCELPIERVAGLAVTTLEGLGTVDNLHPLQETFLEEQAGQCGYCTAGFIMASEGLLNRVRYPSREDMDRAFADNLCRCGTYDRIRRAVQLRVGRPEQNPIYEVLEMPETGVKQAIIPSILEQNLQLDAWIRFNINETITVFTGKVEIGQGLRTALAQIVAEELDVNVSCIHVQMADTMQTVDEGTTAGSRSIETTGTALQLIAAEVRHILLSLAFEELEATSELIVNNGVIIESGTDKQTTYWKLKAGQPLNQNYSGVGQVKNPEGYQQLGQPQPRIDLLDKVTGEPVYVHDLELTDMLHARVVRPPSYQSRLKSLDVDEIEVMGKRVEIVRNGSFVAVVAEDEYVVIQAIDKVNQITEWENVTTLPEDMNEVYQALVDGTTESGLVENGVIVTDDVPPINLQSDATHTVNATYRKPYIMHGSMGPSTAAALWNGDILTIWSHTQAAFNLRDSIADVLNLSSEQVRVIHVEGAGCYGHNAADDVALDAALIAIEILNRPILCKWTRQDEHAYEPYGTAMVLEMKAGLDSAGTISSWNHDVWSYQHSIRPRPMDGYSTLLSAQYLENPIPLPTPRLSNGRESGGHRNADPIYNFKHKRVAHHFAPDSPLRVSALRGLGSYANGFAIESFMDELAYEAGLDPIEFRLQHLDDERARQVIEVARDKSGWTAHTEPSNSGKGQGFAMARYKNQACYVGIVVDVSVDRTSGNITLDDVLIVADVGQVVIPDGLSNQLEGGFVQSASWTLFEQVQFNEHGIQSVDWDTYPILKFEHAPKIQTIILNRPQQPFLGAGEGSQPPTPAAIANAVYDAIGIRLRDIPFRPDRVRQAFL